MSYNVSYASGHIVKKSVFSLKQVKLVKAIAADQRLCNRISRAHTLNILILPLTTIYMYICVAPWPETDFPLQGPIDFTEETYKMLELLLLFQVSVSDKYFRL